MGRKGKRVNKGGDDRNEGGAEARRRRMDAKMDDWEERDGLAKDKSQEKCRERQRQWRSARQWTVGRSKGQGGQEVKGDTRGRAEREQEEK